MIPGPLDRNQFRRAGAQGAQHTPQPVSYTHLDVYKRQVILVFPKKLRHRIRFLSIVITNCEFYGIVGMGIPLRLVVIALPSFRNGKRIAVSSVDRGCDGIRGAVLLLNLQFYGLRLLLFRISPGAVSYTHLDVYKRQVQTPAC